MTNTGRRQQAHALIETISPEQLSAVLAVLEVMAQQPALSAFSLPVEDELVSGQEEAQAAATSGPWTSIEEVMVELNITPSDLDFQRIQDNARLSR